MYKIDATHDPQRTSWVASANDAASDFPIQNLPYCLFDSESGEPEIGVGIGDLILGLRRCGDRSLLAGSLKEVAAQNRLNELMALNLGDRGVLRKCVSNLLSADSDADRSKVEQALVPQADVRLLVPCTIRDYTDFYASLFHATNVGSMFRPNNPLFPNYKHIPIGYHGRASSIVASGTEIRRPLGQKSPPAQGAGPSWGPCKLLDYELEVGFFVGRGNELGVPIPIDRAEQHLFGMCLVNDWSARDIQKWEYQPLGPFLGKSFATTISPWIITMEALAPFRCPELERAGGDPAPLDYLASEANSSSGGVDLQLEVYVSTNQMREAGTEPERLSSGSFRKMYWTIAQMLTHHSSNGCNLQTGDLMASGTVSGADRSERGSLLELTWNGDADNPLPGTDRNPLMLPTGEERTFLGDGDQVVFRGYCESQSHRRIGFGECRGTILPAVEG